MACLLGSGRGKRKLKHKRKLNENGNGRRTLRYSAAELTEQTSAILVHVAGNALREMRDLLYVSL